MLACPNCDRVLIVALAIVLVAAQSAEPAGKDVSFKLTCRDGFVLDGKYQLPKDVESATAKRVIILLHGSGPQGMDIDLTSVTKGGKKNLLFKELSETLADAGFAVVRYHKRAYQVRLKIKEDAKFVQSPSFASFQKNFLKYYVDDAHDSVKWCRNQFPKADVFLLGHSQGTYVALQVARQEPSVKGVAMIGFYAVLLETLMYEQTVYRPLRLFRKLDVNRDEKLDKKELAAKDPFAGALRAQMGVIDLDKDGAVSQIELQAAQFSQLLYADQLAALREQESKYPRAAEILKEAKFKVAFFQGLLDNQSPAYHTKAVEMMSRQLWKKSNFRFTYFPKLGHALDPRTSYDDLEFSPIAPEAKKALADQLGTFFANTN